MPHVRTTARLAAALLALTGTSALHAQEGDGKADIAGKRYVVLNHTGGQLACRYRVDGGNNAWQPYRTIAASREFSLAAGSERETITLDCRPQSTRIYTVRPGERYRAVRENGVVVVRRLTT